MRQSLIKEAQNNLQQRRLNAETAFNLLMQPVFEDKDYVKLEKEKTQIIIENAKQEADGKKPDAKKLVQIDEKIEKIKEKYGLSGKKIEYGCNFCKDEGYVDGKMCKCLKKEISSILLSGSGFEKLENFDKSIKTSNNEKLYSLMQQWCNKKSEKNLIYIAGPTGVGKTHLVKCMANELIENGKVIKLVTAFNMNQDFKEFKKTMNEDLLNKYLSPEVLFIDDLGTEPKYKDVTIEYLYLVINERKMKKLQTVITSNLDLKDLRDRYDERISSRIMDRETSINIYINGQDRRLKK